MVVGAGRRLRGGLRRRPGATTRATAGRRRVRAAAAGHGAARCDGLLRGASAARDPRRRRRERRAGAVPAAVAVQQAARVRGGRRAWSLVGLGGGGWWLTSGRYTPVPAVGQDDGGGGRAGAAAGRLPGDAPAPSVIDDNVPKGDVIGTSPSGRALPGATIVLTVSQGPRMITVPPIPPGDSVAQAKAALRAAGLTVSSTTKPVGVGEQPGASARSRAPRRAAGTSWPENQPVTVKVVAGLALPNLVGQDINTHPGSGRAPTTSPSQPTQRARATSRRAPSCPSRPRRARRCSRGRRSACRCPTGRREVPIPDVQGQQLPAGAADAAAARLHSVNVQQELASAEQGHQHEPVRAGAGRDARSP